MNKEENKSIVNIRAAGKGFIINVDDDITKNSLAVTRDELERIVVYGESILKNHI